MKTTETTEPPGRRGTGGPKGRPSETLPTERLISVPELAEEFDVPVATIYQWQYRRTGPRSIRVGRYLRFRRSDIEAWLDSRVTDGSAA